MVKNDMRQPDKMPPESKPTPMGKCEDVKGQCKVDMPTPKGMGK